jgi:ATP-binding cassette subfamily B protein RaxB
LNQLFANPPFGCEMLDQLNILPGQGHRTPVILQMEGSECGLACLAMVSGFHGGERDLSRVRQMVGWSGQGGNLETLADAATILGFNSQAMRCEPEHLVEIKAPCILHWGMQHFVVLTEVRKKGIVIHDPAYGRSQVPWVEVGKFFTGVAFTLEPNENFAPMQRLKTDSLFKILQLKRWRSDIAHLLLLSTSVEIIGLLILFQQKLSIDAAIAGSDSTLIWILGFSFLVLLLIQRSVSLLKSWLMTVFTAKIGLDLRGRFTEMLHGKPAEFFATRRASDIFTRSKSTDYVETALGAGLVGGLLDALTSGLLLAMLVLIAPALALVCLIAFFCNVAATVWIQSLMIDRTRWHLVCKSIADSTLMENIRAALSLRVAGRERDRIAIWKAAVVDAANAMLSVSRLTSVSQEIKLAITGVEAIVSVAFGAHLLITAQITLGTLFLFFSIKFLFMARVNSSIEYLLSLRNMKPYIERAADVLKDDLPSLANKERIANAKCRLVRSDQAPEITLVNLGYRFSSSEPFLFRGLNLTIRAGESLAITGESGCGKSTLLKIVSGLIQPTEGQVLIDGVDLSALRAQELARVMGCVMQEDQLFSGSIAENIALFSKPIRMEKVIECTRTVGMHRVIESMPMEYMTLCGDTAGGLSGGQKQRLYIARALYQNPKLLILDEATSHLDERSEQFVSEAIKRMQITRIVVAHRKETIEKADRMVRLDQASLLSFDHDGLAQPN